MRSASAARLLASIVLGCGATGALALEVGDPAPDLDVSEWVQNGPITIAEGAGKKVYLVEFWRTFMPECIDAIPRLDKFVETYKAQGLEVIAITTEAAPDVKKFLADHPCAFRVAADQFQNADAAWAHDVKTLPYAVLVDRKGIVVWKGDLSPSWSGWIWLGSGMSYSRQRSLDDLLPEVVAGKFDLEREREKERRRAEMQQAGADEEWDKLAEAADKVLELEPTDETAFDFRVWAFRGKKDLAGYRNFVRAKIDHCKSDGKMLSKIAQELISDGNYEWRDVELAVASAKRAVDATKSADAGTLEAYANILYSVGMLEQAIEQQKKVVALDDKDPNHKKVLTFFETCLAVRRKLTGGGDPSKKK